MKPLIPINWKKFSTSYFFQAFYAALLFAGGLLFNDLLDEIVDESVHGSNKKYIKLGINTAFIFFFTFGMIYFFHYAFGWGRTFLG